MSYIQTRRADVGQLLSGTFIELGQVKRELGLYFGGFALLGLLAEFAPKLVFVTGWLVWLGGIVAYWVGNYFLYQVMLRNSGALQHDGVRVFQFFFMAMLIGIAVLFGANFLVIPGVLLGAKWVMAPSYLVARDRNLLNAMGDAWSASDGNTMSLSAAFVILFLIWIAAFTLLNGVGEAIQGGIGVSVLGSLGFHILPILLMGLSVTAYKQLSEEADSYVDVFA
ncbi:MAG: hypothetical protein R3D99_12375 [Altererythrobacter sp.]